MFNNQPFDLGYGDWLQHAAIQQQQLSGQNPNLLNNNNNASNSNTTNNSNNPLNGNNVNNSIGNSNNSNLNNENLNNNNNSINNVAGLTNSNNLNANNLSNNSQNAKNSRNSMSSQTGNANNNKNTSINGVACNNNNAQAATNALTNTLANATGLNLSYAQNPYMMQLNQLSQRAAANNGLNNNNLAGLQPQLPILYDPNNPYSMNLHQTLQPELNSIQQMQMLILQEQQTLDATLKDENPNDRFKRYQAAYAKILQHQSAASSYGQQANLNQLNNQQYLGANHNLINPLMNIYNGQQPLQNQLLNQQMLQFNPAAQQQQLELLNQMAQNNNNNNNNKTTSAMPTNDMDTSNSVQPTNNVSVSGNMSPTPGNNPSDLSQQNINNTLQLNMMNKNMTSSGKSNGTDQSSVTGDSALGRSSTTGSTQNNNDTDIRQTMTNSRAQQNRIKEGVVASAAQLTPGLFSNAENIQEFLGLAENPQIHVPCTAKCYHKCKLGISCPRHAHKHHERKIRKQKQAAAAAAAAAATNGTSGETSSNHGSQKEGSCKGNKSIETSSSMSVCSDTFNNLDKKSGKDGKKRTFLDLYEVYNVIGVGGGGMVYSGRRIQDKLPVAIKRVMREKVKRWETVQGYQVPQEIALMLRCYGHPGIIKLVDWYECLDSFILIMERPERAVDLFDYIREIGRIPEKEAARIFKQILDAAMHIQNCGVVHRDIKDENIIINRDTMEAKLIDFGCGTLLKDGPYRDFSGTPEFYPPEWFVDREYYARTACVWSLGVLLFDMTQGEIPFKQKEKIVENKPTYKHPISESCQNLIKWCMNTNQNSRPSLEQIQCHMWVMLNCLPSYASNQPHPAALSLATQQNALNLNALANLTNPNNLATNASLLNAQQIAQQQHQLQQIANNGQLNSGLISTFGMNNMNLGGATPAQLAQAQMQMNALQNQMALSNQNLLNTASLHNAQVQQQQQQMQANQNQLNNHGNLTLPVSLPTSLAQNNLSDKILANNKTQESSQETNNPSNTEENNDPSESVDSQSKKE